MTTKRTSLAALAIACTAGIATAAGPGATASVAHITIIDDDVIRPSILSMHSSDVLEFTNYAAQAMVLSFTEPRDPMRKIRCRLTPSGGREPLPPDPYGGGLPVFSVIPLGRSASACSLEPGRYVFVMRRLSRDVRAPDDELGATGVITVQP